MSLLVPGTGLPDYEIMFGKDSNKPDWLFDLYYITYGNLLVKYDLS